MHGMAQAVGELTAQGAPAFEAAIPILSQLLEAETAEREVRSTAYQLKTARFPAYRDLNGFDYSSMVMVVSVEGTLPTGAPEVLKRLAEDIASRQALPSLMRSTIGGALVALLSGLVFGASLTAFD